MRVSCFLFSQELKLTSDAPSPLSDSECFFTSLLSSLLPNPGTATSTHFWLLLWPWLRPGQVVLLCRRDRDSESLMRTPGPVTASCWETVYLQCTFSRGRRTCLLTLG